MAKIPLTQGQFAIIDDSDFEWLNQWKWYASKTKKNTFYAQRQLYRKEGNLIILMHRLIMNTPNGMETDHKNGDGLDNRRENLRVATRTQNQGNSTLRKDNKTGYKGVHWFKPTRKWRAQLIIKDKFSYVGYFDDLLEASEAYNQAAKKYFGEFARLNNVIE